MQFDPANIETLVVKIGTNLLSNEKGFDGTVLESVIKDLCQLKRKHDLNVLIVTSGAVGCGMNSLKLTQRPDALPMIQAAAAVGQSKLMHFYETLINNYGDGYHAAQILLTQGDLEDRVSYLNVRNTIRALFDMKTVIPVVNENDSTAVEELRFSDNDTLAAKVAAKKSADVMVILTDVDGLYDGNPSENSDAKLVETVSEITPEIMSLAGGAGSMASKGGMRTKLEAARIATAAGVNVIIANGRHENVIRGVLNGDLPRTLFTASGTALPHRKRWIAFARSTQGILQVDDGARNALVKKGTSLLAAGIVGVEGEFEAGDTVDVSDLQGQVIARGLVNYASADVQKIKGSKSTEIEALLGSKYFDEVIHRDNLALV